MTRLRLGVAALATAAALIAPATAGATIGSVFTGMDSPAVTCTVQPSGVNAGERWCNGTPSLVKTWDGTAIDVSVAFPPEPGGGEPAGGWPLVGVYHGWGGSKSVPSSGGAQRWLNKGYAVFSMTDRGWNGSCGTNAAHNNPPAWGSCANGDIRLMDFRYEVRDAQYLMGHLVEEGVVDPNEIGAQGGSYGGMTSSALGALRNRVMLEDGTFTPWRTPDQTTPIHIAAATPSALGTDVLYTQQPNGAALDYAAQNPYFGPLGDKRVGVQKFTVMNGFLGGANGNNGWAGTDLLALAAIANGPGPYDPAKPAIQESLKYHGSLNVPDDVAPAPMLLSDGWSDDFVGADESVKLYNRIRSDNPQVPVSMYFADQGHARAQDKTADSNQLRDLQNAWMDYYVKGEGTKPPENVVARGITCGESAPSTGPFTFPDWASMSPGELRLTDTDTKTIAATGTLDGGTFVGDGSACNTIPATDNPATVNYRMPATDTGFTVAGSPTLLMRLNVTGPSDQLAARLLDVAPDGTAKLVDRGLLRPEMNAPDTVQTLQLHPNMWHIDAGHLLKLELMPDEYPYSHLNSTATDAESQHPIDVLALQLRVPTMEAPGASGGQIQAPLNRYLPPGYTTAVGYEGKTTTVAPDLSKPAEPQPVVRKCNGVRATIAGTSKRDVIKGTRKRDVIVAFGGNDKIFGYAGNDLICAGAGNDTVYGGKGNDKAYGQAGKDTLRGGDGRDTLNGAAGPDRLLGGRGRDVLKGGPGEDVGRP